MDDLFVTQAVYRDLLVAMSRPGTVCNLRRDVIESGRDQLMALAITLLDREVSFFVLDNDTLSHDIETKTCSKIQNYNIADYIFIPSGNSYGKIREAKRGSLEYPDRGATIIYQVEQLSESAEKATLELRGPGIESAVSPEIKGLEREELLLLGEINIHYPLGIDVLLIDLDNKIMALPRSVKITIL